MPITRPNQVWRADITCIPMKRGYLYLVTVPDWYGRDVLSRLLLNTMDADSCVTALEKAMNRYGVPYIFNTDQGSQFNSCESTRTLRKAGVRISMDGRGRWMDNFMIERLWRSLKYECVYWWELETGSDGDISERPQARGGTPLWPGPKERHSSLTCPP